MKIECGLCKTRNCSQEAGKKTITKNPQGEITAIEVNGRGIEGCLIRRQILSSSVII